MGQRIQVRPTVVGVAAIFDTDRSITGQDGTSYESAEDAASDDRFPGRLAARLFQAGLGIETVWVASNTVVVTRGDDWDDTAVEAAGGVIEAFFVYYA